MKDTDRFRESIRPYLDQWQSIDIRTICFLAYEKWVNLGTRIVFSEKAATDQTDPVNLPALPTFCALQEVRNIGSVDGLLDELQAAKLTISEKLIHYGTIEGNEVRVAPLNLQFQQARRGTNYFHVDYPYISLVHSSPSLHNLLHNHEQALIQDELDWKLRSLKTPYNGLDDLLINFIGLPRPSLGGISSAHTEIIAPLRIRLGSKSALSNGRLTVHVEGSGDRNPNDVSIGVLALSGTSTIKRIAQNLAVDDLKGSPEVAYKEIHIGEAASSAVIFLTFKNKALDIQTVNDPAALLNNPRILAYSHFDQDLTILNEYLLGKGGDQSRDFEIGVGLLFHFCGFNVGPYGRVKALKSKSIQEEIDHLVFAPSGNHIVAIECTKKDLDTEGKLSKFSRRVKEIRDLLPTFRVIPLVCTPLSKAIIADSDVLKAAKEHIGVIGAEEIQTILELAGQNKNPEEILEFLDSLIIRPDDMPFWST